jgi:hypothetical protein
VVEGKDLPCFWSSLKRLQVLVVFVSVAFQLPFLPRPCLLSLRDDLGAMVMAGLCAGLVETLRSTAGKN